MTPERWQLIDQLYHNALEREANQRAAFLNQACGRDAELRHEVESLLASHEHAGTFMAEPALKVAARVLAEDQTASSNWYCHIPTSLPARSAAAKGRRS